MAKIDRGAYTSSSSEELKQSSEEIKARENSNSRGEFLKPDVGVNVFRLFPSPRKAKSSLFCFPKVTSYLPMMVDEYNDKKEKTGNKVEKRKAVFNAKVHGGLLHDVVEEYVTACIEKFSAVCSDKKELYKKLEPITGFKTGIKPSTAWVAYASKIIGKTKNYGRLQITDGVHKQMDSLCLRQGESGVPIIVDLFSHPDTGKMIQWMSDPNNADAKSKNKISILFEKDAVLLDEELEMLESWDSLETLYKNCYSMHDFKLQLEGLQRFDMNMKLNIFESPSFQSTIETCKLEVEAITPGEEEADGEVDENVPEVAKATTQAKKTEPVHAQKSQEGASAVPAILEQMDKKTLTSVIQLLELDVEVKITTPPTKLRQMVYEAICSSFELEGTNTEKDESITQIIENAFNLGAEAPEQAEEDPQGETDPDPDPEEEEMRPPVTNKAKSLMAKYSKK